MKIAYLASDPSRGPRLHNASVRYRALNLLDALSPRLRGVIVALGSHDATAALGCTDALVCLRPLGTAPFEQTVRCCARRGQAGAADFDDLLFDPALAAYSPLYRSGKMGLRAVAGRMRSYRRALEVFERFTVSTGPLAEHLRRLRPGCDIEVIPNALSPSWLAFGDALPAIPTAPGTIRYFPGTTGHTHDFETVRQPLARFLRRHPQVRLEVVGRISVDASAFPAGQFAQREPVDFHLLPALIKSSWVTIAPLADNPFNECKSAIKLLESAAWGIPLVATPIPDMLVHGGHGVLFARTAEEWEDALERLLDADEHARVGAEGRTYVRVHGLAPALAERVLLLYTRWTGRAYEQAHQAKD